DSLEPVVPPPPRLLEEADRRAGCAVVGVVVAPGSDEALPRRAQPREETRDRVRVGVRPAADGVDGARDACEILADRAAPPVGVAALVAEPYLREEHLAPEPREPLDDRDAVLELLLVVLVEEDAVRVARAAHVDTHGRVAVPGEVAVHRLVPGARQVALAVRDVLEDRGHRRARRGGGQPEARR